MMLIAAIALVFLLIGVYNVLRGPEMSAREALATMASIFVLSYLVWKGFTL